MCVFTMLWSTLTAGQAQLGLRHRRNKQTKKNMNPTCIRVAPLFPHFLHRDYSTVQDCEQNKPPPHFLQWCSSFSLDFLTQQDLRGEPVVELSSLGITPAWVFGSA